MGSALTDDQIRQIRDLLKMSRKLAAVKLYKEWTGDSLADAKRSVERLHQASPDAEAAGFDGDVDQQRMDKILDAIEAGKKLEAVKLYRQASGLSLRDSKLFIDGLMRELGVEHRAGCVTTILAALILSASILSGLS